MPMLPLSRPYLVSLQEILDEALVVEMQVLLNQLLMLLNLFARAPVLLDLVLGPHKHLRYFGVYSQRQSPVENPARWRQPPSAVVPGVNCSRVAQQNVCTT